MRRAARLLVALLLAAAAPAAAEAPGASLRPEPRQSEPRQSLRPGPSSIDAVRPAARSATGTVLLPAGNPDATARPRARPTGVSGPARAAIRTVAIQLPAIGAIPRPRPRPSGFESRATRLLAEQRREAKRRAERQAAARIAASAPATAPSTARATAAPRRPERPGALEGLLGRVAQPAPSGRGSVCGDRAIRGQKIAPVPAERRGCGIAEPVRITEVSGVRLSTPATVDCPTAQALNTWVRTGAKPAIGRTGGGLAALQVAAHYACRTRNNRPGARVSEHGRGRAIDISALVLANGQRITVLHGWRSRQNGPILRRMHASACGPFGTVLGPAADRYH